MSVIAAPPFVPDGASIYLCSSVTCPVHSYIGATALGPFSSCPACHTGGNTITAFNPYQAGEDT